VQDAETDLARIVGFEVEPYSIAHKYDGEAPSCLSACTPHYAS